VKAFPPSESSASASVSKSLRAQTAAEGIKKTLENFEAFRIVSQRTQNLQVVDSREINLRLKDNRLSSSIGEKKAEMTQRRERNLMASEMLQKQASEFVPPMEDRSSEMSVLGVEGAKHELPPWAIHGDNGEAFNFRTGRFGDPHEGRLQELSDGRFKVLPRRDAAEEYRVDAKLLKPELRSELESARRNEDQRTAALAAERSERMHHQRFRRFDSFVRKAKDKQRVAKERDAATGVVTPISEKKRMSHYLRAGNDKRKLSTDEVNAFSKPL
jgi:hypothetical protein